MSALSTREIRRRIQSISSTKKITHTMEMIAAVKMRKAIDTVINMRAYAYYNWHTLCNLIHSVKGDSDIRINRFLEVREPKNYLLIVVTSNRGLCGSFNTQILGEVNRTIKEIKENNPKVENIDFVSIGKKAKKLLSTYPGKIYKDYPELTYKPHPTDIRPLVDDIIEIYQNEKYDRIHIIHTDYVNSIKQDPIISQLLPIDITDWQKEMSRISTEKDNLENDCKLYRSIIEPNPIEAFKVIFPKLTVARVYHSILESNASKEAARMIAMKNATDTANEMVDDLTLEYNKLRQAKITQEIAEISAGTSI